MHNDELTLCTNYAIIIVYTHAKGGSAMMWIHTVCGDCEHFPDCYNKDVASFDDLPCSEFETVHKPKPEKEGGEDHDNL